MDPDGSWISPSNSLYPCSCEDPGQELPGWIMGSVFSAAPQSRPRQGFVHQRAEIGLDHLDLSLRYRNQGRQIDDHLYGGFEVGGPAGDWPPGLRRPCGEASPLGARRMSRLQLVAHRSGRTKAEARPSRRGQKTGVVLLDRLPAARIAGCG